MEKLDAFYKQSPFRETVSMIFTGFSCNLISWLLFAAVRIALPSTTPDVGQLVRDGNQYWNLNYAEVTTFALSLYALALAIAFAISHPTIRTSNIWTIPFIQRVIGTPVLDARSSWTRLFHAEYGTIVRVGCSLDDGSWVDGWIYDWNAQPEEDADRTLTIQEPIRVRPSGQTEVALLEGVNFVTISHSKIARLDVVHVDESNRRLFDESYRANSTEPANSAEQRA